MSEKIRVLFMQSQTFFGSDSMIHSLFMRYYDRSRVEVFVACNKGTPNEPPYSLKALENVPDLHIRPTNFGATVFDLTKWEKLKNIVKGLPALVDLAKLAWYIKKNRIDVIHCTEKPRDAFYGLLLARITGAKCVIHMHVKAENWISPLVRWAMKQADGLIGVSDFVAKSVVAMGYSPDKAFYVLNSIDASKWDYKMDGSAIRREFNIPDNMPLMGIMSRLFVWKGHTELLKALAKVKESNPNFKLLIVGEDDPRATPGRGSYMEELKTLTKELDLGEQVIFTGFRKDIAQILAACDIYTMPTFEEPCAVAFLEALAMKKPVIALDSGGTPQLVEQGKAGLLSQPQDIDQLAANILTLINDPALRKQMGDYARMRVEQYFNPQRMANEAEQIYRKLLGKPAPVEQTVSV